MTEILTGPLQLWIFHDSGGLAMSGQLGHQDFGISGIFLGCLVQGQELDLRILVRLFQSGHSTFPRACSLVFQEQQQAGWVSGGINNSPWLGQVRPHLDPGLASEGLEFQGIFLMHVQSTCRNLDSRNTSLNNLPPHITGAP